MNKMYTTDIVIWSQNYHNKFIICYNYCFISYTGKKLWLINDTKNLTNKIKCEIRKRIIIISHNYYELSSYNIQEGSCTFFNACQLWVLLTNISSIHRSV